MVIVFVKAGMIKLFLACIACLNPEVWLLTVHAKPMVHGLGDSCVYLHTHVALYSLVLYEREVSSQAQQSSKVVTEVSILSNTLREPVHSLVLTSH